MKDFTLEAFAPEGREWTLESPRAHFFELEKEINVETPRVSFYDQDALSSNMESGRGRVHTGSEDLWAWDDVLIVSTDGVRLTSDWMHYVGHENRIISTAPVTIVREGTVITGVGWEASPDLSEVVVHNQRVEVEGD